MADARTTIRLNDDDKAVRLSLDDYLGDQDYRVFVAENGRKGFDLFENEAIDYDSCARDFKVSHCMILEKSVWRLETIN